MPTPIVLATLLQHLGLVKRKGVPFDGFCNWDANSITDTGRDGCGRLLPEVVLVASAPGSETFGARIRRLRHQNGLTQRQLAARVGIDFTYLSKLENDQQGQSPGEDLVGRLAEELDVDPEELLALAGKVPVDLLRSRAREDPEFARSLRRLPAIPRGRIAELVTPPPEMPAIGDLEIVATFEKGPDGAVTCNFRSSFDAQQDQYLIGLVGEKSHRDRLRDDDAPIHDLLVIRGLGAPGGPTAVQEIVQRYRIAVRCRDGSAGDYEAVELEQLRDTSTRWTPRNKEDEFPLSVLRARLPPQRAGKRRRIEVAYRFTIPRNLGLWFWRASRPTYVSTITVDARQLTGDLDCVFEDFLPNYDRGSTSSEWSTGMCIVTVRNWLVKGHGVALAWSPLVAATETQDRAPPGC
jgi:HTH-type transcriptional regulator, competence development regulator